MLVAAALLAIAGCGGGKEVIRTDAGERIDLSGNWNDTDAQTVSAALADQIQRGAWIENFLAEKGKKPTLIVAPIRNKTAEHIATKTLVNQLERDFINGGRVRVVASSEEREQVREERADQQEFASPETMKKWGREKGADVMLIGEINQIIDREGKESVRYYQVDCYLVDLEDNTKLWAGDKEIKKLVKD
ncbi:MAG: penicillin-binding protein activator LpoB [bacterium]|nr:penicillin-binding protein activator LpoB [bacterium]